MASKYRKITISVSNDELNDFEDYCVVDFQGDKKKEEKCRRKTLLIWTRLVKEWDKA
jgi:hypothetical protein